MLRLSDQVALGEIVRDLERLKRRDRRVDALYRGGFVVGFGALLYGTCMIYRFLTDAVVSMNRGFAEAVGSVTPVDFQVDPYLATAEAAERLLEVWQR